MRTGPAEDVHHFRAPSWAAMVVLVRRDFRQITFGWSTSGHP